MKYSIPIKALAIVLAAAALLAAVCGGVGMIGMVEYDLYRNSVEDLTKQRMESATAELADSLVREYISTNLVNAEENWMAYSSFFGSSSYYFFQFNEQLGDDGWSYTIADTKTGNVLASGGGMRADLQYSTAAFYTTYTHQISMDYPQLLAAVENPDVGRDYSEYEEAPAATTYPPDGPTVSFATAPEDYDESYCWYNEDTGTYYDYYFDWLQSPEYTVEIHVPSNFRTGYTQMQLRLMMFLSACQNIFPIALWLGLAVFAAAMVYLILAAGRKPGTEEVRPAALNRLPLDLYTAVAVGGALLFAALSIQIIDWFLWEQLDDYLLPLAILPAGAASVLCVGFFYALAAQFKVKGGYWWRNSLLGRLSLAIGRLCRRLWQWCRRMISLMPCMWQWAVTAVVLGAAVFLTGFLLMLDNHPFWFILFILCLIGCGAVVAYGAYAFGIILEGARRMAKGNLNTKINTTLLFFCFEDCANQLNALADVAMVAAKNQLKSDRMKTELITNVSHDIKTPLTSIINYVDLLQKPHTAEEGEEYLAVLSRQSQQMKKLIEDLMEMSKATTGNLAVEITTMDAIEAVNQALGEFADKLSAVPLTPVFRHPQTPVMIRADGRLVWRTLSNLLQNAVKYALPGTRLYMDVAKVESNVVISLKNISREELNISADELMERFVRGDASRNTEGSGLGLNIAKSLMELQRGQLRLLVDGDLFKASLIFPSEES